MLVRTVLIFLVVLIARGLECNATMSHYLSPHSLGKQDEIADALKIVCPQVRVKTTTYSYGKSNYTIYNTTVRCVYNDGRQTADIPNNQTVTVSGGLIQFLVDFNYSISRVGSDQRGWGYASVMSEAITFMKRLAREGAQTVWILDNQTLPHVTIQKPLNLKRSDVKLSNDDLDAMNQALDKAISAITPSNVKQQISQLVNDNFTSALNKTLKEEVFNTKLQYNFSDPVRGDLQINLTSYLHLFKMGPEEGFELMYLTFIENGSTTFCKYDLPIEHKNYSIYGGIQSAINFDLMSQMTKHAIKNGWLHTTLGSNWETSAFQFFMGDLYNIIPKTGELPPRTKVIGECQAQDDMYFTIMRLRDDTMLVIIRFLCHLRASDTSRTLLSEFESAVTFSIKVVPKYQTIDFVVDAAHSSTTFKPVGDYVVQDQLLAEFKVNMALRSLIGMKTFGSGFPTWPRDNPEAEIFPGTNYLLIYDSSQIPH